MTRLLSRPLRCFVWCCLLTQPLAGSLRAEGEETPRDPQRTITVVALQAGRNHYKEGNPGTDANFNCLATQAKAAAAQSRPDLIVFPEYALMGSPYPPEAVTNGLAEPVPGDGPWYRRYRDLAREIHVPLVAWLLESDSGRLYNCACVIDADGEFVGKYRKVHCNLGEQTWFGWSQGESFAPVELDGVRYGFSICSDMWHPETVRCNELLGADVVLHQSIADDMQHLVPARAFDSHVPIVMSIFQGGSYAVDATGTLLGKLPPEEPAWQAFELKPFARDLGRKYGGVWDIKLGGWNVRNPSAYTVLLDPSTRPAWTSVFFDDQGQQQSREQLVSRFKGRYDAEDPEVLHQPLVTFAAPWTSVFRVDPLRVHHLVNEEGQRLFILNKTAWAYFGCQDPEGYLDRAAAQGVSVIRVALEGQPYWDDLHIEMWPWGGTREQPDFATFNAAYWDEVERRIRLAGERGLGIDLCLYFTLKPENDAAEQQRPYWQHTIERLSKYANIVNWEIHNEYLQNEAFQDVAGTYFHEHDPQQRPVCTSDGTTDDAAWPSKPWVDLAINHTCTSSTERHGLRDWYLALARNTRSHGKPAWCNESGRERRHQNDDGVHRRKQGWLWYTAGCFWTHHSWDGCEGIDNREYRAPGEEYLRPMTDFWQSIPFWTLDPNFTVASFSDPSLVSAVLCEPDRELAVVYVCTERTGEVVSHATTALRLPPGLYDLKFINTATNATLGNIQVQAGGIRQTMEVKLPDFTDDLAITLTRLKAGKRTPLPGTQ